MMNCCCAHLSVVLVFISLILSQPSRERINSSPFKYSILYLLHNAIKLDTRGIPPMQIALCDPGQYLR